MAFFFFYLKARNEIGDFDLQIMFYKTKCKTSFFHIGKGILMKHFAS